MRIAEPDRFSIRTCYDDIEVRCAYENCGTWFRFSPQYDGSLIVPIVLGNVLRDLNEHVQKVHKR